VEIDRKEVYRRSRLRLDNASQELMILKTKKEMIAVCGLDCGDCEIYRVPTDPEAAKSVAAWFKERGWLREGEGVSGVVQRSPYCKGCRGDRNVHWSADCWILKCCVDGKGLEFCSECSAFPCEKLDNWANQKARYGQALDRLKRMKEEIS